MAGANEGLGYAAEIVFDKFHFVARVNQAVDEPRRAESRRVDQADGADLKARWCR